METGYRKIRLFVASSSDVSVERDALAGVVNELNTIIAAIKPEAAVFVELLRWETSVIPGFGRPQSVINEQISDYDIFIGIMWKRFGTPTGVAESGTEEEFRIALEKWEERRQPHIMFYFSAQPSPPPSTQADVEQWGKVVTFRDEISKKGLVWPYPDSSKFADVVRPHLASAIGQIIGAKRSPRPHDTSAPRQRLEIEITDVAPEDAYYEFRHLLVGKRATPHTLTITGVDGWSGGVLEFDKPPLQHESGTRLPLFRFRWEASFDE